jgi:predicted metalloprotease
MTDPDRERETVHDTERTNTTVVTTGGDRGGGGGVLLAVLVIVVLLAVLYFVFSGSFNRAADKVGVNVNVDTPKVAVPDINLKVPDKIEVKVPDVNVKTDADGNKAR